MVYLLAVAAALSNALTSVFQRMGVEDAPEESTMRLSLMAHALRRGVWLLGFGFMVLSFLFQSVALHLGSLSVVQPILTMELLFLVAILGTSFHFSISAREWIGAAGLALGLSGFLFFAAPGGGGEVPSTLAWVVAAVVVSSCIAAAVVATRWGPRWWKAAMFGTSAAFAYAFTAALVKTVGNDVAHDWVTMFGHWQTYGVAVFGLLGVFLTQNAFHAGPLAASGSTLVLVDPLVSIGLGIGLYGDALRTAGPNGPLEALSLAVMVAGAVVLSNSPLITGIRAEGAGVERDDLLAGRLKHPRHSVTTASH
jgi:hypothetical protein